MSFIQCDTDRELERFVQARGHGFCSPDRRIYDTITLSDDACYFELESEMVLALFNLQTMIEFTSDAKYECPFQEIENAAKELKQAYDKVLALIKTKPIRKVLKPERT